MPTATELVKGAKSPSEALLLLAERVTELESQPAPSDGWGDWEAGTDDADASPFEVWTPDPEDIAEVERIENELRGCEDADESTALRAQLLLARDKLVEPREDYTNEGERTVIEADEKGNTEVEAPAPTPEQEDEREVFAREKLKLEEQYGEDSGAEYIQSYRKVGPNLLYLTDRDFVLGLPPEVKQEMIADLLRFSPEEAHEMSRDIMKVDEAPDSQISIDVQTGMADYADKN